MAVTRWTTADDEQLTELHAAGFSLTVCARRMNRSTSGASTHAKRLGLDWDRTKTRAATQAQVADNRSMRSQLEAGLLADAARLRAQLFAPTKVFNFGGKDNTYTERNVDQPPFVDQLKIMQAASIAVTHSLKIAVHDGDEGIDTAIGMLDGIAAAIAAAAGPDEPA